jgi:non-homologous end joining protein Ku
MAAPRSTKTRLAFGLVTCDVALYKATGEAEKPRKWDLAGPNGGELVAPEEAVAADSGLTMTREPAKGNPLAEDPAEALAQIVGEEPEEPFVVETGTGEKVYADGVRKGIRHEDGTFSDLTDGLEEIAERTKLEEMRVADFIRVEQVQRERVLGSYYMAPDGPGAAKVVRLLHEAMRHEKRVGVVKWTKRSKQALGVLVPHPPTKSLIVLELAWAEDLREAPAKVESVADVAIHEREVTVAVELVQAMCSTRAESLDAQVDESRQLVRDLIERVEAGEVFELPERPAVETGADVIDMMERGLRDRDALAAAAA